MTRGGGPTAGRRGAGRGALVLWSASLPAVATSGLVPAFTSTTAGLAALVAGLLAAVCLPFGLVALGARLRVPAWTVAAATTSLVLLAGITAVRGDAAAPTSPEVLGGWRASGAGEVLGPLADAGARLLTAPRPAVPEPAHVVPVLILVALVGLAVALAVRRRTRPGVGPLVGACVVYVAGLLLTAGGADPHGVLAGLLVLVAAAGWVLLDGHDAPTTTAVPAVLGAPAPGPRRTWRPATPATLAVVVLAASATVTGTALTGAEAFEPREHVTPPVVQVDATHPLPQLSVWATRPEEELLVARGDLPERLSFVVLPEFDGAAWRAGSVLRPLGAVAEPALPPGDAQGRMDATIELRGLAVPSAVADAWLPTAGQPVDVSASGLLWDVETGSLLAADGFPTGAYRVTADVDQASPAALATAGVPSGAQVHRYLEVPRMPADMLAHARAVTSGATSRLAQARAIEESVRADRELAPDAASGSSYARVREFLFADREAGGQVGTAEQFAASFAVLARAVGLPTRLVLGFVLPDAAPDGSVVVRAEHAHVWPEVYLAGPGWVAFDPSPAATGSAGERDADAVDLGTDEVDGLPVPGEDEVPDDAAADVVADEPVVRADASPVALVVLVTVLAALALVLAAVGVARALRRSRARRLRRQGASGAWQHLEDVLVLAGAAPRPGEDARQVAARTGEGPERAAAQRLASLAEAEAFGPARTHAGSGDEAWELARGVERAARRRAPWHVRLTWAWHPGPLGRRVSPPR